MSVLCWHRLVIRRRRNLCQHCGVEIEECPCVTFRVPNGKCELCLGSGWLAVVRSNAAKFLEYIDDRT